MTDYLSKLQSLGIDVKGNTGTEPQKTKCPKCSHTRRKNKNEKCLRVWVETGTYYCHHCGENGSVVEYKSDYEMPTVKASPLSSKIQKFFKDRGISDSTIEYFGVTEGIEYMPQVQCEKPVIQFNYIRKGRRINIKFRDSQKNFKLNKGSEMIMYGLDLINPASWCVITEGEFDAMAFYEAGLQTDKLIFACSVPNGASTGNQNLTYLDNSIDEFENKEKVYCFFGEVPDFFWANKN